MAIIKCKMCGGDLDIISGESVAECEYCGSRQTVPVADNERKLTLFGRANRLRAACEFDKAAGIYETIVGDFPEEAEAYWGLVLCKYGIEYVDDPATGKKIPTCHRSSFDSVMDDSNLEQALENTDTLARKVYREEAKQIEEIRKGIIAVSSNEEPFDIFICYKETDDKGNRTLDSVLAQDIYEILTGKGYRTFFARITLEDKLGQEYEPYIFGALNSAKIMLAVGTDYEYYNAVWVKNEWSRYLKLMSTDKDKHLIPCYKDIDAYDMPKEFARLQAQDLGKVGAMQDLLRGIEKILPKANAVSVVQERVVVGSSDGNNKITSLLDRGHMALEDGDWDKADAFFEDVLNNDSKNAQAYIGKTLAAESCRSLNDLIRKRIRQSQNVIPQTFTLPTSNEYADNAVRKYKLPGYIDPEQIGKLYEFDLSYTSEVAGRKQQYRDEEKYWSTHKLLSRAEKFAVGGVAEDLQREKNSLFTQMHDRVKKAEEAEDSVKSELRKRYETHLKNADKRAEALYKNSLARREAYYQDLIQLANSECDIEKLKYVAGAFEALGTYRDSENLAKHCKNRLNAEIERQKRVKTEQAFRQYKREQRSKRLKIAGIATVALGIVMIIIVTQIIIPLNDYNAAEKLLLTGDYEAAIVAFENLGDFKDSEDRVKEAAYASAEELLDSGDHFGAAKAFYKAGNYKDAWEQCFDLWGEISRRDAVIDASGAYVIGLKNDGTVCTYGYEGSHIANWGNFAAVSSGNSHIVGLQTDGTVVVEKTIGYSSSSFTREAVAAISAGGTYILYLRADGTVEIESTLSQPISSLDQEDVSQWTDIVAISAGTSHAVGLKADGTVVAAGDNTYGQCNVSDWQDIIAISASDRHTVGLKANGTVVAVGDDGSGQCDVSSWDGIVAISAGSLHTAGLKANGEVVVVGSAGYPNGKLPWSDIVAICAGRHYTIGVKADGTVVVEGQHRPNSINNWMNIKCPD